MAKTNQPKPQVITRIDRDCLCQLSPVDTDYNRLFTCNACRNAIVEEKNRLVRENYELRSRLENRS